MLRPWMGLSPVEAPKIFCFPDCDCNCDGDIFISFVFLQFTSFRSLFRKL